MAHRREWWREWWRAARGAVGILALVVCAPGVASAAAGEGGPEHLDEPAADDDRYGIDEMFGPAPGDAPRPDGDDRYGVDEMFGGEGGRAPAPAAERADFTIPEDPLAIGGQLYLRLMATFRDGEAADRAAIAMPNLLDLYLDARPATRVRGFFSGRLRYDPTVTEGSRDAFGQSASRASVLVDRLWIRTDIARSVFLTVGQQRVKWGASRIWNPTDFLNRTRRDPLAVFDERTGVPMVRAHVPFESLGWNAYGVLLLDGVSEVRDVGGALRLEMVFGAAEIALSSLFGRGRKTSFGADLSAALGDLDVTVEFSLTDERDTPRFSGTLDLERGELPTEEPRGAWVGRISAGVEYQFKPNPDDVMIIGAEYFYNPLGYGDPGLYPWLAVTGQLQPFYLGRHYAAVVWLVPAPGSWNNVTFGLSNLANLSDRTFVTRLDFSATLHTRLRLEAFAQVHYGRKGGELRFSLTVPDLPAIPGLIEEPVEGFTIPAPLLMTGVNLRVSL